ncbi:NERD domain-containing protein [Rheinheimera sp. WS51]|uniref:nuclease-related domain-containing protein n=1 Tax=Rheinheimera sp. WS51 TaxID=3425886 RepID=UPI003D922E53
MILKEKTQTISSSAKLDAGIKQEQDVAFYLRRAYKDRDNVMVINDLRIEHDGEVAQIDHLIVYSYGFIVVESKSIRGEVSVNEHGEWSRSYKGQWSGMPSPIKQAELQLKLLKQYLCANTLQVIGKFLGIQQGLGARCYDVFCAISSDAIIDRANATKEVADKLVKSEFIADALDKKMNFIKFYRLVAKTFDTRPSFNSGTLFYRFISENFVNYITGGDESVNYAAMSDDDENIKFAKEDAIKTKGYFLYPSQLFSNVAANAHKNENLNTDLAAIFAAIENSANGYDSEKTSKAYLRILIPPVIVWVIR